ncbi:MAG: transglycosylase domain-containing protein [Gemmatimonadales bacterium]
MVAGLLGWLALARLFTVSCPPDVACVGLRELARGEPLPEALHLYDRDEVMFAEVAGPLRRALPREQIPDLIAEAFVAVEDRRFWEHGGVDGRGVMRAALENLREGGRAQGASTIPMQLVRTLWAEPLRGANPWRRKVIEARLAPQLIEDLGHERVLTLYLNSIYLGNGVYGIERAARYYFGVGVEELSVGQIATLVGITRSPEWYEPLGHPERALDIRNSVLRTLMQAGVITEEEAQDASSRGLELARTPEVVGGRSHLTAAVTRELRRVAPELAGIPGLSVHTSVSSELQAAGEAALEAQLRAIEQGRYGRFGVRDSSAVLEGSAIALDPASGSILAWIGGRDFRRSEFDRVEQARRQVGSLIKPFLVAEALEQGYGIIDLVSADTVPIQTATGPWLPSDHVNVAALPLREALVRSSNRAAAHLGQTLGVQTVVDVAERAGLSGPIPAVPATSLGAFEATLLEMTTAYATFGTGGHRVSPHLIERIEGPDGALLWARPAGDEPPERVIGERAAFVVLDALQAVVDRGTGAGVRSAGFVGPAAGKTGTTNDGRDAWFVGLTPGIAAGVWIGFDQPREIVVGLGGGALAAPVWGSWMRRASALDGLSAPAWSPPLGVQRVRYDPATGEVLDQRCRAPVGGAYYEAWVFTESYDARRCRGGLPGFFDRLWHGIVGRDYEPLRPLIGSERRRAEADGPR